MNKWTILAIIWHIFAMTIILITIIFLLLNNYQINKRISEYEVYQTQE